MTNPQQDHRAERHAHFRAALDQARQLSEVKPERESSATWWARAAHVGDFTVLALAIRD